MFPQSLMVVLSLLIEPAPAAGQPAKRSALEVPPGPRAEQVLQPRGRSTLGPVPSPGDAADDPAIWIHPRDPERSLVLVTDKLGGVLVYRFDGTLQQIAADGSQPNNVDVLYDFTLGGVPVDLALASCGAVDSRGVRVWVIEPATRRLVEAGATAVIPVFGGGKPYGLCVYRSARTGKSYFFVTRKGGGVEQYELYDSSGTVAAKRVRSFALESTTEGCVADDEQGDLYLAEEDVGIWKIDAEPRGGSRPELIARVGENGLAAEVEGLALYCATGGKGYLIASSQGNDCLKVYDRQDHRYLLTIDPRAGRHDDVEQTDGVAVTNVPTSREFPKGVLVVHDGVNAGGKQDFHLYCWEELASGRLIVDTRPSPRPRRN